MHSILCNAINSHLVLTFYYNGGYRTVEPFCYGRSGTGKDVLRGYQTSGYSESGDPLGWRLFDVSKISSLTVTEENFVRTRPGYNPNDSAMGQIYCRV